MTAVDEPVDVAGLVAADGDRERYWQRVYATLRAYPGLRPDDRVSRCGRCRNWVIHPEDHGGRAVNTVPRPWAAKAAPGCRPVCGECHAPAVKAKVKAGVYAPRVPSAAGVAVLAGYAVEGR